MLTCPQHATASPTRCPQPPWSANSPSAARSEHFPTHPQHTSASARISLKHLQHAIVPPPPMHSLRVRDASLFWTRAQDTTTSGVFGLKTFSLFFPFSHPHSCPEHTQHCPPIPGFSLRSRRRLEGLFFSLPISCSVRYRVGLA